MRTVYKPRNATTAEAQYILYAKFLKAARLMNGPRCSFGGNRRARVRFVTPKNTSCIKPRTRIVHLKLL